jgi:hypothetical protein
MTTLRELLLDGTATTEQLVEVALRAQARLRTEQDSKTPTPPSAGSATRRKEGEM